MSRPQLRVLTSKAGLVRQHKQEAMINTVYMLAVRENTCQCGHWAIRHLGIGSRCREKGCKCWYYRSLQQSVKWTASGMLKRWWNKIMRRDNEQRQEITENTEPTE